MRSLLVLICAMLPLGAHAGPWDDFALLRQGTSPRLATGPDFERVKSELASAALRFAADLSEQARSKTYECKEFVKVTGAGLRSLADTMGHFKDLAWDSTDDESILAQSRLILLVPSIQVMQKLFALKRDGGYGTLTLQPTQDCAFNDRARLNQSFQTLATQIEAFRLATLGSPGLIPFEHRTDRLLALADGQQSRYDQTFWVLQGVTLTSTMVLWELAPAIAAVRIGSGWTRVALLGLLGLTEGVTYQALDYFANPEPEQREREEVAIPSWEQNMRDIKVLVDSSFDQPQLYLAYLTAVQARLAGMVGQWVHANQGALDKLVSP